MAALPDQEVTVWFPHPHEVVATRDTVIKAPVYDTGALLAPTSGTVTIRDESYVIIVNAAPVTISGDIAQYTVPADTFPAEDISELLYVEWSLVFGASLTIVADNDGVLVARELRPVITDEDLYQRLSSLDPSATYTITTRTSYQDYIDSAWRDLISDMIEDGTRPHWIRSPSSTRQAHVELTLARIFEDLASRNQPAYLQQAEQFHKNYRRQYGKMTALIDKDDDGQVDHRGRQGIAHSVIWLG